MSVRHLNQTLTYWAPPADGSTNLYGKPTSVAPVQYKCRWENKTETLQNKNGEEFTSKTRIFLDGSSAISLDGYVFLGVSAAPDPTSVAGAQEIQQTGNTPDLRGMKSLTTIYL